MRLILLLMLSGCVTPYVEGGLGYSGYAGWNDFDETGCVAKYGAGIEFVEERWYSPSECGWYHRSMCGAKPEIVTNDYACMKRVTFGE